MPAGTVPIFGEIMKEEEQRVYAVIKTGGKQYRVQQDDVIFIEKIDAVADETVTFEDVLLIADGEAAKIGTPTVAGAKVVGKVISQVKSKKIVVYKYKAKKNERKKQGHRQPYTKVQITEIVG